MGGRQPDFALAGGPAAQSAGGAVASDWKPRPRPVPLPSRLSEAEAEAHAAFVAGMGEAALWKRFS